MRRRYRDPQGKCFAVDASDSDRERNARLSIDRACVHPGDDGLPLRKRVDRIWYGNAGWQI